MISFDTLFEMAAQRKGGPAELEKELPEISTLRTLRRITDDRWLAEMTKRVFQAGFNWSVIERKWDGFETAFDGFNPRRWSLMSDEDIDLLIQDARIVRNGAKIQSVGVNAKLLCDLADEHGSAAVAFADWPDEDFAGLLDLLKTRGSRLGGTTASYLMRGMGKDSFVLSQDVVTALIREDVIAKVPTSKRGLSAVQAAFNHWRAESGRSLTHISKVLAFTV